MDGGLKTLLTFVDSIKGKSGQEIETIILQALEHPDVFVFAELLHTPEVSKMSATHEKLINTLELFSTGTYLQYLKDKQRFITLSKAMEEKLQLLSLLTLCTSLTSIPYPMIQQETNITDPSVAEALIIDGIYKDIFRGKLDHKKQCFQVESSVSRDIKPEQVRDFLLILDGWEEQLQQLDRNLSQQAGA